jgi:hypothetical protein
LPLSNGSNVTIDFTFYWQGSTATMKYSVTPPTLPPTPVPPTR